ncbi:P-loop containing nucleoside triphosphate hydrolase protein, partial [Fomitopsis serialis]|uniref:P-loop containing nucleoside triphosphate hydrolase protein n=1 Tax=Fomitopsis serialis TaxID=139415 RepID=UPI0020082B54
MCLHRINPSYSEIRRRTIEVYGQRPCILQIQICAAILRGDLNVAACARTGFGKSLAFMMPLLFSSDSIIIVVTALNLLGSQTVARLEKAGINSIAISGKNDTEETAKAVKAGQYRLVVVNPEVLMKPNGHFECLWDHEPFTRRLLSIVFDEAHCISTWGTFRPDYKHLKRLRYLLTRCPHVRYCLLSATLSATILHDIYDTLNLTKENTLELLRPNDRPNVFLAVREMQHSVSSFKDLDDLVAPKVNGRRQLTKKKFIIFFDNIKEAEACCLHLRSLVGPEDEKKLIWFHSIMSDTFREDETSAVALGERTGVCGTDSLGMGIDIKDIELIIQWKLTCNMETLWQRFGRGARDPALEALAIIFVEPKYFDEPPLPPA